MFHLFTLARCGAFFAARHLLNKMMLRFARVIAHILSHATSHTHGRLLVVQLLTHAATTWMLERSLCTKSEAALQPDLKLIKNLTRLHKMFQCLAVTVLRSRGSQNNARSIWLSRKRHCQGNLRDDNKSCWLPSETRATVNYQSI